LFQLIKAKVIDVAEALSFSNNPNDLKIQLQSQGIVEGNAEIPINMPPGLRNLQGGGM
ncbi:MAG: hypothetical protein HY548_03430, partial [Elusimicrobia bacterium]|nr:hypothetical protein [Elusimicrobiota bacterium]